LTVGRQTNADLLNLQAVGLESDPRGRIAVNDYFQTDLPHVYAAGDVIGFPALASTSMEQGRLASCHMFGLPGKFNPELLPYGIYTIPEISMVGKTEQELTEARVPYEVGIAKYEELAKVRKECGSYWRQPNKIAFFSHALSISDSVERL